MSTSPDTSSSTSQPGDQAGARASACEATPPVSIKEAAARLSVSVNTIRRWIREGRLKTERVPRPQGYVVYVHLPEHVPTPEHVPEGASGEYVSEQVPIGRDLARAEAMAAYTRSLLEPLTAALERSQGEVAELRERVGRQGAELNRSIAELEAERAANKRYQVDLAAAKLSRRRDTRRLSIALAAAGALAIAAMLAPAWVR